MGLEHRRCCRAQRGARADLMIYLASTSANRKALLRKAGIAFRSLKPSYEESDDVTGSARRVARTHAIRKAESCVRRIQNGVILSADTIICRGRKSFGKPADMKEARRMLAKLQGKWHTVYTGVAIYRVAGGRVVRKTSFVEKSRVRLKRLAPQEIRDYFKKVNPLNKSGAYAIQSPHGRIIGEVRGLVSNVVGLPIERLIMRCYIPKSERGTDPLSRRWAGGPR